MPTKKLDIGLRQAKRLCNMTHDARLTFIAEGMPIILKSAQGFWDASCSLKDRPREAEVLEGFAKEEAAKILILMNAVRCPVKVLPARIGTIVGWFYDHLARLIYAESVAWAPMHVTQLREYVKENRKAHYLEGFAGQFILPNWDVYRRESQLYVDVEAFGDGEPHWSTPTGHRHRFLHYVPPILRLVEAMSATGIFTPGGIKATSEVWSKVEFKDTENREDCEKLIQELLGRLIAENLPPSPESTQHHVDTLFQHWQLPMYDFDFTQIHVPVDELREEQDRLLWSEIGDPRW